MIVKVLLLKYLPSELTKQMMRSLGFGTAEVQFVSNEAKAFQGLLWLLLQLMQAPCRTVYV